MEEEDHDPDFPPLPPPSLPIPAQSSTATEHAAVTRRRGSSSSSMAGDQHADLDMAITTTAGYIPYRSWLRYNHKKLFAVNAQRGTSHKVAVGTTVLRIECNKSLSTFLSLCAIVTPHS